MGDRTAERTVFVVEDDYAMRESLRALLEAANYEVIDFSSATQFLMANRSDGSCLISNMRMPRMSGLELQQELIRRGSHLPIIFITGYGDVAMAVRAMKAGAVDFLEKPFDDDILLQSVDRAIKITRDRERWRQDTARANEQLENLSRREIDVLEHLAAGRTNKEVAAALGISPRTVEIHRSRIMRKLKAHGLSDLVRVAIAANLQRAAAV